MSRIPSYSVMEKTVMVRQEIEGEIPSDQYLRNMLEVKLWRRGYKDTLNPQTTTKPDTGCHPLLYTTLQAAL